MPRRVFIFLKKTGNSVSYLPHRQLRKYQRLPADQGRSYLPHRQLRKLSVNITVVPFCYLPHRQLRNCWNLKVS